MSSEARFWGKVDRRGEEECWVWLGSRYEKGYGCFEHEGERRAHRVSWVIHFGAIPTGLYVCHSCDNPSCVNPHHLWLGTASDNTRDAVRKGRQYYPRGEHHSSVKLTAVQVREIRRIHQKGSLEFGACALARKYAVSSQCIDKIVTGKTWAHV